MGSFDNTSSLEKSFSCLDKNLSREDVTQEYWSLRVLGEQHTSSAFGLSVVFTLMFIIGVTWNLIVIAIIIKKRLYNIPSVLLLLNLAITDLLFCLLVMPFSIVTGFAGEYIFGKSDYMRCQVCNSNVITVLLMTELLFTLLLLTIDRLIYLIKPLHYNSLTTAKRIIIGVFITWLVSIGLSIPPIFGFGEMGYDVIKEVGICTFAKNGATEIAPHYAYYIFLLAFTLPCVVAIIIINVWTICVISKHVKRKNPVEMCREKLTLTVKEHFVISRIFLAINLMNIVSWLPIVVIGIVATVGENIPPSIAIISFLLFFLQPVIHPILQVSLIGRVRSALKECCKMQRCRKKEASGTL